MIRGLLDDTRRAAAAILAGTGLGVIARVARASSTAPGARAARPTSAIDWSTMDLPHAWTRLVSSLAGTAPMFLQLALIATGVVAAGMLTRAALRRWRAAHPVAPVPAPMENNVTVDRRAPRALVATLRARIASRTRVTHRRSRRATPAAVRSLAESGASRAEIARRTGLSQDAVGLALAV